MKKKGLCCCFVFCRPFSDDSTKRETRAEVRSTGVYCKIEVKPKPRAVKVYPPTHFVWSYVLAAASPNMFFKRSGGTSF